jgi:hypothetical protein
MRIRLKLYRTHIQETKFGIFLRGGYNILYKMQVYRYSLIPELFITGWYFLQRLGKQFLREQLVVFFLWETNDCGESSFDKWLPHFG